MKPAPAEHILPQRFVKIRYYGILGSRYKKEVQPLKDKPDSTKPVESRAERLVRLTGFDPCKCPYCKWNIPCNGNRNHAHGGRITQDTLANQCALSK
ncbi:MAG: hypothetical protein Q7U47_15705 [Paludibacter sp.]|nr:hypothetical protein [Paludibacter sp.]